MRLATRPVRAAVLVLSATLLAGPLTLGPAVASEEPSDGSGEGSVLERPYGDEIEPGTSYSDTTEVGPGTYTLNVPATGEDHYFEIPRTDPDDVIWFGTTLQTEEPLSLYSTFTVESSAEGDTTVPCNNSYTGTKQYTFLTTLFSANRTGECRNAESIVLRIANDNEVEPDETIPTDTWYQLVVWTEPPVDDTSTLPDPNENSPWVPMEEQEGEPQPLEGARTFADAEELADGYYSTTIRRGTPQVFAVPLTFGQHAQVLVENDGVFDGFDFIDPVWVSPMGGQLRTVEPSGGPPASLDASERGSQAGWSTPIVTYANRRRAGGVGASESGTAFGSVQAAPAAFAGTYYLVLELEAADGLPDELPLLLDVRTVTDYEGSPPDYAAEPAVQQSLDGSGYEATQEERREAQEAEAEPAPWLLVGGLFAGAALLAAVGGVAVGRVVRSRS